MDNSFEDELSCPICYVNYDEKVQPIIICGNSHIVCDPCLWKMYIDLNSKLVCPLCKLEIENKGVSQTHMEKGIKLKKEEDAKKKEIEKQKEREMEREKEREKERERQNQLQKERLQRQNDKGQESSLVVNRVVQPAVRKDLQMPAFSTAEKEKQLRQINPLHKQFEERVRITESRPPSAFISSSQSPTQPQVKFSFASPSNPVQPSASMQKPLQNKSSPYLP